MSGSTSTVPNNASTKAIHSWSQHFGIPAWIPLSIAKVESNFNPTAKGDLVNGNPTSFGLFQLHTPGGQGVGYTTAQLLDPNLNAQVGIGHMQAPYQAAVKQGLTGYGLLSYVASHSGHPLDTGTLPTSYNEQLQAAYSSVTGNPAPSSTISTPSGISGTITKVFFGIAGFMVIGIGLWVVFNPASGIGSALNRISSKQ